MTRLHYIWLYYSIQFISTYMLIKCIIYSLSHNKIFLINQYVFANLKQDNERYKSRNEKL